MQLLQWSMRLSWACLLCFYYLLSCTYLSLYAGSPLTLLHLVKPLLPPIEKSGSEALLLSAAGLCSSTHGFWLCSATCGIVSTISLSSSLVLSPACTHAPESLSSVRYSTLPLPFVGWEVSASMPKFNPKHNLISSSRRSGWKCFCAFLYMSTVVGISELPSFTIAIK